MNDIEAMKRTAEIMRSESWPGESEVRALATRIQRREEGGNCSEIPDGWWSPTPGAWATILPGADRGGVPAGVDRVLVMRGTDVGDAQVTWEGPVRTWQAYSFIPASSLGPVQPRVWAWGEDVPAHAAVVNETGEAWAGKELQERTVGAGTFTEILP